MLKVVFETLEKNLLANQSSAEYESSFQGARGGIYEVLLGQKAVINLFFQTIPQLSVVKSLLAQRFERLVSSRECEKENLQESLLPTAREGNVFTRCSQSASWILGHCSPLLQLGRYASYWNAFLFYKVICGFTTCVGSSIYE